MEVEGTVLLEDGRLPGFLRVQEPNKRPYYRSPFPRKVLNTTRTVEKYLENQHKVGRLLDVVASMFSFKRLRDQEKQVEKVDTEPVEKEKEESVPSTNVKSLDFWVEQLTPKPEIILNHRLELSRVASLLDEKLVVKEQEEELPGKEFEEEEKMLKFEKLKEKLLETRDAVEMMDLLHADKEMTRMMTRLTHDVCLAEISRIDSKKGPLAEFPPSVNTNMYCEIVKFGLEKAPVTMEFYYGFVVKQGHTVRPSHVVKLATLFANLCFSTNRDLDALTTLRSLTLQLDRLTDQGLDLLACQELAKTARTLSNLRDKFSAVGPMIARSLSATMSSQSALDNCDVDNEHLTVEYLLFEDRDQTKHLSTEKLGKVETLKLFNMDTIMLSDTANKKERDHLKEDVIATGVGLLLAKERPEAKKLAKFLPKHHHHSNEKQKLTPAQIVIQKPYPLTETKNSHACRLMILKQRKHLAQVAIWKKYDPKVMKDISLLEDKDAVVAEREAAEQRMKVLSREYGECLDNGDLLTKIMYENAKAIMSGSVTAFGRLEFLAEIFMGLMHFDMKKLCLDYKAMMKSVVNFDDEGCLAWLASVSGKTSISNNPKDIKKDDCSFEHHKQVGVILYFIF